MKKIFTVFIFSYFISNSCQKSVTEAPSQPFLKVNPETAGVTDAFIKISSDMAGKNIPVYLKRNDRFILSTIMTGDTVFWDKKLDENSKYIYRIYSDTNAAAHDSCIIKTLGITSHNFSWQLKSFGNDFGLFRDVYALNPDDVWVAGEIKIRDTLSNNYNSIETTRYNLAHWNGNEWELLIVTDPDYGYALSSAVFAFNADDVWASSYTVPKHWDGAKWTFYGSSRGKPKGFYVNRMWGTSSTDMYFACDSGKILHFDGFSFQKMNQVTDVNLTDIWGTSPDNIWACGYTQSYATALIHYDGVKWSVFHERYYNDYINLDPEVISGPVTSIWTNSSYYIYLITYWGLYKVNASNPKDFIRWADAADYQIWFHMLRGNAENDMGISGSFFTVYHFNGADVHMYEEVKNRGDIFSIYAASDGYHAVGCDYISKLPVYLKTIK